MLRRTKDNTKASSKYWHKIELRRFNVHGIAWGSFPLVVRGFLRLLGRGVAS